MFLDENKTLLHLMFCRNLNSCIFSHTISKGALSERQVLLQNHKLVWKLPLELVVKELLVSYTEVYNANSY